MSHVGDLLFVRRDRVDLDTLLRHRADVGVRQLVDQVPAATFESQTDSQIAETIFKSAPMKPLEVAFDQATAAVEEISMHVNNVFGDSLRVKGLRATKAIPFVGEPDLWHLNTNPYDFSPPHGYVRGQTVVIGLDVREGENQRAMTYINDTIAKMRTYLERQAAQIDAYNKSLPMRIAAAVQQRRRSLGSANDLLKQLQG